MLQLLREHLELSTFPILALCWRHFLRRAGIAVAATSSYSGALQAVAVSYQRGLQRWSVCASADVVSGRVRTCSNIVIPRLTKIIRSGITFVSRNVISRRFL
jgi:hypothetical protein